MSLSNRSRKWQTLIFRGHNHERAESSRNREGARELHYCVLILVTYKLELHYTLSTKHTKHTSTHSISLCLGFGEGLTGVAVTCGGVGAAKGGSRRGGGWAGAGLERAIELGASPLEAVTVRRHRRRRSEVAVSETRSQVRKRRKKWRSRGGAQGVGVWGRWLIVGTTVFPTNHMKY